MNLPEGFDHSYSDADEACEKPNGKTVARQEIEPLVSVIVPVYNCATYLLECLESVYAQTYSNWELICIDDGSTDESMTILREQDQLHGHMRIVEQENLGPAKARNCGIDMACGEYLLFIDADDFIEPTLLEKAVDRAKATDADIVIWDVWFFDDQLKQRLNPPVDIVTKEPFNNVDEPFSWQDNPDQILLCFQNWPWNKLFKTSFVREHDLRFQEDVMRTEDVMFTCAALLQAKRLVYLDERLSNYRVARVDSAMNTKDKYPLDFLTATLRFKTYLIDTGLYDQVEAGYATWALSSAFYNLHTLQTLDAFLTVRLALIEGGFVELGIIDNKDRLLLPWLYDELSYLINSSAEQYIFDRWRSSEKQKDYFEALSRVASSELPSQSDSQSDDQ